MVKIRLTRTGRKKLPCYRIVVADSQFPRDGRYLAHIGQYDPKEKPAVFTIDEAVAIKWLARGAQPTETVKALMKKSGLWKKFEASKAAAA